MWTIVHGEPGLWPLEATWSCHLEGSLVVLLLLGYRLWSTLLNNCLVKLCSWLVLVVILGHTLLIAGIELLILHFLGPRVVGTGLLGVLSGLLDLSLHLHLLLLGHALLGRQMLELVILVSGARLLRRAPPAPVGVLKFLNWFDYRRIFNVDTVLPPDGHPPLVHEIYHFLSDNGHLKDLRHRWAFLGIFIQERTYQVLQVLTIARGDRVVFILHDLKNEA